MLWEILKDSLFYPYQIQGVQALLPRNFPRRTGFYRWYLQKAAQNPLFQSQILFTDGANFSRNAVQNFHNNNFWSEENHHTITESHFQEQFSHNVWVYWRLFNRPILSTRTVFSNDLPTLLEDVYLLLRQEMWFMHDGVPAHFSILVRDHLNEN